MYRYYVLAVAVTAVIATTTIYACGFDSAEIQASTAHDLAQVGPDNLPLESEGRLAGFDDMRIVFSMSDLDDSSKYCTAAGQTRPTFASTGATVTCTDADVFTAAKKQQLVNDILPHAKKLLAGALQVKPLTSNLKVGSTTACSGGYTIPQSHVDTGVANADFVLYVSAGPTSGSTIAWASGCQYDNGSPKRIIVGRANFGPKYLDSSDYSKNLLRDTGTHEILHALGFSLSSFETAGIVTTHTVRGRSKKFISSATAKQAAREYLDCYSVPGVELEDEGGSGTANSHVDRRIFKEDIMCGTSGRALSMITLSIMKDLGVYSINYTNAENMIVGKDAGCGYADGDCTTTAGGKGDEWCSADGAVGCTNDLRGYGPCRTGTNALLTDTCPYHQAYSNRRCDDATLTGDTTGNTFHADGRCVVTAENFKKTGGSTSSTVQRCLQGRCINTILSFSIGGSSWATCYTSGSQIAGPTGTEGKIVCPNITRMCDALQKYANRTTVWGPLPPAEPVPTGKDNRASDYYYTAKSTLVLSGTGWPNIIKNHFSDLLVSITLDVAQYLKLQGQQVWLRAVSSGDNWVRFVVTINDPKRNAAAIQKEWEKALNDGGRNWMPRTANLYSASSGASDTPALGSASTDAKPDNLCVATMPSMEDEHECNGLIAGLVFLFVGVAGLFAWTVYACCCRYQPPPQDWKYLVPIKK